MLNVQIFISLLIGLTYSAVAQKGTFITDTTDGTVDITEKSFTDSTELKTQNFRGEFNVTEQNFPTQKTTVETDIHSSGSDNSTNIVVIEDPEETRNQTCVHVKVINVLSRKSVKAVPCKRNIIESLGLGTLIGIVAGIVLLIGISSIIIILIVRKMGRYSRP